MAKKLLKNKYILRIFAKFCWIWLFILGLLFKTYRIMAVKNVFIFSENYILVSGFDHFRKNGTNIFLKVFLKQSFRNGR
jgi:hypothetical protein